MITVSPNLQLMFDTQKTDILAQVEATKTLVTDKATETKNHVSTKATETQSHVTTETNQVETKIGTDTSEIDTKLESLTTTDGKIDTSATEINNHTAAKLTEAKDAVLVGQTSLETKIKAHVSAVLAALSFSPVKSVQRGEHYLFSNQSVKVGISPVNLGKAYINVSVVSGYGARDEGSQNGERAMSFSAGGKLVNSSEIFLRSGTVADFVSGAVIYWEVIEYV